MAETWREQAEEGSRWAAQKAEQERDKAKRDAVLLLRQFRELQERVAELEAELELRKTGVLPFERSA